MSLHTPAERVADMRARTPDYVGACARTVWQSLGGAPALHARNASEVVAKVRKAGKLHTGKPESAPFGAILLWTGGSRGFGHAALRAEDPRRSVTVDWEKPGAVGEADTATMARKWGLKWAGWTTWYGVDLPMDPPLVEPTTSLLLKRPTWKVGDEKVAKAHNITIPVGEYVTVGEVVLPKGGDWRLCLQGRFDAGIEAKIQFVRIKWGADSAGGTKDDQTGLDPVLPPSDGKPYSWSRQWPIAGPPVAGRRVAYQVRVLPIPGADGTVPKTAVLRTVVVKAIRRS